MKSSFLILIAFVVGLSLFLVSELFGSENLLARILLAYSAALFLFILLDSALDPRSSLVMVVISFYHVGMFLFPGMLHSAQGWFPFYDTRYNTEDIAYVSMLVAIYASGILAGYVAASRRRSFRLPSHWAEKSSDSRIMLLALLSIAISIPCVLAMGWEAYVTRRADITFSGVEPTPFSIVMMNVPRVAGFCASVVLAERMIAQRNPTLFIICVPVFLFTLLVNNPLTLPRFYFFSLIFVLIYASGKLVTPRSKLIFASALAGGLVVFLPLADTLSRGGIGDEFQFDPIHYLSTHGDFDGFQSSLNVYLLTQRNGLSYGWQLLSSIFTFVPREFWPTKSYPTGQLAGEAMGFLFDNLSAPLPAEIYVDFGIVGVLLIPFGLGYVASRIDQNAQQAILSRASMAVRLFYGGIIGYVTIVCRGSLEAVLFPVYLYFGFVAIWYLSRVRSLPKRDRLRFSEQRR
jgi:hypothetical protein